MTDLQTDLPKDAPAEERPDADGSVTYDPPRPYPNNGWEPGEAPFWKDRM